MKNKRTKKIMFKNFSLILYILLMTCLVCACGAKKTGDMVEDDASVIKYGQEMSVLFVVGRIHHA